VETLLLNNGQRKFVPNGWSGSNCFNCLDGFLVLSCSFIKAYHVCVCLFVFVCLYVSLSVCPSVFLCYCILRTMFGDVVQGCHDLSLAGPRTNSVQYSQPAGGPSHQLPVITSANTSTAQRRPPCSVSSSDSTDHKPVQQTSSTVPCHCSEAERRDLCDKYGIVNADLGFSTRHPDAGLPPVDLDLVDGVVDRMTVDVGGRPTRELLSVDGTPLFGDTSTLGPREKTDSPERHDTASTTTTIPRRVNFDDDNNTKFVCRPLCSCGTRPSVDRSPYYFKLNELDAPAVSTSVTTDRSPLIIGRPAVTSDKRHSDVMIGSQCRDQFK